MRYAFTTSFFWFALPALALAAPFDTSKVTSPEFGSGLKLSVSFQPIPEHTGSYAILRSDKGPDGPWLLVKKGLSPKKNKTKSKSAAPPVLSYEDKVVTTPRTQTPKDKYWYRVLAVPKGFSAPKGPEKPTQEQATDFEIKLAKAYLGGAAITGPAITGTPHAYAFKNYPGIWLLLALVIGVCGMMFLFARQVRQGKEIKIRRIPGIDAIEEGIGRATEMGKPVLYVPGIDSLEDIQTIASMLILGEVSKTIAEYQTDVIVSCCVPIVREVADEVVRSGYYRAGHPDAFDPTSVRFIAADQFAFCAGTNGIMYRQKPATNIYLGRFFAESLILAETGYVNQAIQIAGTAEATQLPFFIAACDYTLIGEELFAVSAYLSQDARLVSSLKASDWVKVGVLALLTIGVISATLGWGDIGELFRVSGG